jgi:predicted PurR-regulated permease PerM
MTPPLEPLPGRSVSISLRSWAIGAAVVALAVLVWDVVERSLSSFVLLFTAMLLAEALRPPIDRLGKHISREAAVGIVFATVIVLSLLVTVVLVQPLGSELVKLVASVPDYVLSLQTKLAEAQRFIKADAAFSDLAGALANAAGGVFTSLAQRAIGGPALVASLVGNSLLIVLLAVGWVITSEELLAFVLSLLPLPVRGDWRDAFDEAGRKLGAYTQGMVLNGAIVGVVCGAAFALIHVPFALLLGFVAAVFQAIPMIGAVISGIIIILATLATAGWSKALLVAGIFAAVQIVDQNVLSPIIFGRRVQISFLLIVFATVVGGTLLGIAGAFLAVPAAAVIQTIVVKIVAPAIRLRTQLPSAEPATNPL